MHIVVKENSGQVRIVFGDYLDNDCIIQTYVTSEKEVQLRFGVINTHDNHESTPMYLSRADILVLLPFIEYFAKHGTLPYEFLKDE